MRKKVGQLKLFEIKSNDNFLMVAIISLVFKHDYKLN